MKKKILIVGSGGREHALAWKISQDSTETELFIAPGNAGTAELGTNLPIGAEDIDSLIAWAVENRPDLTVVGPEAPLCAGITDRFEGEGLRVFGPSKAAAQLEGSKAFCKEILTSAGVPTAEAASFTELEPALAYLREKGAPIVVKADGLAAGKGVTVCTTSDQAESAVREILEENRFGEAGSSVLIEECLVGEEASILGLIDGEHIVLLASSQDHKRALEGDEGPNTGGMGAYSPAPVVTDDFWPLIREQVFERTLAELRKRGIVFKGVLYAGLMMTPKGPRVLEYNVRFGDPECQAVLVRWDGDILPALEACIDGSLTEDHVRWLSDPSVCVVLAAGGYPGSYRKGDEITGLEGVHTEPGVTVFHAGTDEKDGKVVTSGGRVLGVTAHGTNLQEAIDRAYGALARIYFSDMQFRRDIAWRALQR